jgi:hypothetical protein
VAGSRLQQQQAVGEPTSRVQALAAASKQQQVLLTLLPPLRQQQGRLLHTSSAVARVTGLNGKLKSRHKAHVAVEWRLIRCVRLSC